MTARARNGRFTAERTTETTRTERITERITVEDAAGDDTVTATAVLAYDGVPVDAVLAPAVGWNQPAPSRHGYLAQRAGQREQALGLLVLWDQSAPPGEPVPEWLVRQAVNVLRAGPGATPMELALGRSI